MDSNPGDPTNVRVLIFGGGAAGLWMLDDLRRQGHAALLVECGALGDGQTITAQGILHSGLKYALQGLLTPAAREARDMPALWRECLLGCATPQLTGTEIRSQSFYLWGTDSAASRLGLFGARLGLQVSPRPVPAAQCPPLLRSCAGSVYRVDEQVVSPASLLTNLAERNREAIVRVHPAQGAEFETAPGGAITRVRLCSRDGKQEADVQPDWIVLAAGKGNGLLRKRLDLPAHAMQLRPLHNVMVRSNLPEFYGHCVDGARTRVSITSGRDASGQTVWQVGGQISEDGNSLDSRALIRRAQSELRSVLPGLNLAGTEWSTWRVDRAEGATRMGARPDSFRLVREGNVLTAWPTKLVLVPQLAAAVAAAIGPATAGRDSSFAEQFASWPRPAVAEPIWDRSIPWIPYEESAGRIAA